MSLLHTAHQNGVDAIGYLAALAHAPNAAAIPPAPALTPVRPAQPYTQINPSAPRYPSTAGVGRSGSSHSSAIWARVALPASRGWRGRRDRLVRHLVVPGLRAWGPHPAARSRARWAAPTRPVVAKAAPLLGPWVGCVPCRTGTARPTLHSQPAAQAGYVHCGLPDGSGQGREGARGRGLPRAPCPRSASGRRSTALDPVVGTRSSSIAQTADACASRVDAGNADG
jgi:hypothetical protein